MLFDGVSFSKQILFDGIMDFFRLRNFKYFLTSILVFVYSIPVVNVYVCGD